MKILLINPPMQINRKPTFHPLGIFYISQELKRNGYDAEILDIDGYRYPKYEVSKILKGADSDLFAIGGLATVYPYLYWLVPEIKRLKPKAKIILGGAIASSLSERCFEKFDIDYEIIGEGEITIIELLKEMRTTKNFNQVKGIGYRGKEGKIIFTEKRPLMPSLDDVPMFKSDFLPMESYLQNTKGTLQIHTQRGCPWSCTFCFNCFRVTSSKVRYRPFNKVVDEIEFFKNKYGDKIKLFAISGECITMNKEWIVNFCKEILKRKLKIKYRVTSRVDTIDKEKLGWLKKSGCNIISLGLESGSDKILKIMKKGASVEQNRKAVLLTKKFIKHIEAYIMLGYAGETKETLRETVKFCKEISVRPDIFFATAYPGTELYKMASEKGRIKDDEEYLMGLDTTLILDPSLNLTDMPDNEAKDELKAAIHDVRRHYYFTQPLVTVRNLFISLKEKGCKSTLNKIFENVTG